MKKLSALIFVSLISAFLFAETNVLLSSSASASLDGYDFVSNFEIDSQSGYFQKDDLKILPANEKGFRFMAMGVPKDISTSYEILVSYPTFLNEPNTGAGYIDNAASIKSIDVTFSTNRPYDEVILLYSTSATGPVKMIKMPQDFNSVKSMEETVLHFENLNYVENVNDRPVVSKPVLGSDVDGIYLRGIRIKTNAPSGFNAYSEYSVIYLKEISVTYDNAFTPEQIEAKKVLKEEFGISENSEAAEKAKAKIAERNRIRENEKALMHSEAETSSEKAEAVDAQ